MTTEAETGTDIKMQVNVTSATIPVMVDFGDGNFKPHTIDPTAWAGQRQISGTVLGPTLRIKGNLTELEVRESSLTGITIDGCQNLTRLDLSKNLLTDFAITGLTPLEYLNLDDNRITNSVSENSTLTLENCGATLTNLRISNNPGLRCLDIRYLTVLEYLSANNNPDLGSVFICPPEEEQATLRSISINDCALAHFYPVSLPNLRTLDLANNELESGITDADPFTLGNYPNLTVLNVSGNANIRELDVTKCKLLEQLHVYGCSLSALDVTQAPELITLSASDNKLTSIDLGNNKALTSLYLAGNPIKELNLTPLINLYTLRISSTLISRVNLINCYYLKSFEAADTKLEFVDFNGQQTDRMTKIDLRNNPGFTYESMAYTIKTIPVARETHGTEPTLLLEGSKAGRSDITWITNADMHWICDVTGDGSATWPEIPATLIGATDTGENKTGHLDRLYPYFALPLDYDLDVYQTDGGRFIIAQWEPEWFQSVASVTDKIRRGVPTHIHAYPDAGMQFGSVEVNGRKINHDTFIIDDEADKAEIKVNFVKREGKVSFKATPGQELSFCVNTTSANGTIWIDWGSGTRTPYQGVSAYKSGATEIQNRLNGKAAGTTISIYGDIAAIDISGWGDMAEWLGLWDNNITAIDVTEAPGLRYLNTYFNPISEINLSHNPELEVLDLSYTDIKKLDLSNNPKLIWLQAYSGGEGYDDIAQLTEIDLSGKPNLQFADLKNNALSTIDVSGNTALRQLIVNNNKLTTLDVSKNTALEVLRASGNLLPSIDLSANTALKELVIDGNELAAIDLSKNTALVDLSFSNNNIHSADLSGLSELKTLAINGNGMSADELNDLYYKLPVRKPSEDDGPGALDYNLSVIQGADRNENDGNRADSSIAIARKWKPSHTGTNEGSDVSYLDIDDATGGKIVSVADNDGNTYSHGMKVPKYTDLTINAIPDDGNVLEGFRLNGEPVIKGCTFMMPGIYTRLTPVFSPKAGLANTTADNGIEITTTAGCVEIHAPAGSTTAVYTADGIKVASAPATADGTVTVNGLAAGIYVVSVSGNNATATEKITVK